MSSPFTATQTPPAGFFTIEGIYPHRYDSCVVSTFNSISTITGNQGLADPFQNPRNESLSRSYSFLQLQEYRRQLGVFQRVYEYNACQSTIQTVARPAAPFNFVTYKDFNDYRAALALIDKIYNVKPGFTIENMFVYKFPPFGSFPRP
jgi:hypothetical protein